MEPIIIKDIKTSIIKESIDECYLNPKDNIINEHYNQLLFKYLSSNLLFYLPLNEILVLVLEDKLVIYDLKISLTENLKILDEIYYIKDIINYFNEKNKNNKIENEKIKTEKNKDTTNYFLKLNFMDKEQEEKQIKNILITDDFFDIKGNFIIIIQFMNLDIYIIEYNLLHEINNEQKITFISKNTKLMFIDKNINNKNMISKYDENICKNISKINIKTIKDSNNNIYIIYHHKNNLYIHDFIINEISFFGKKDLNENNSLSFKKISLKNDFNHFAINFCYFSSDNYIELITITNNNIIYYYLFLIKIKEFGKKFEEILCEEINIESKSNISDIKYYKENNCDELLKEKILFVIQLNKIFIIKYCIQNDNKKNKKMNIYYKYLINIIELNEEQIYNVFLLQQKFLYIFTRKNKYIEYTLNISQLKNNNKIEEIKIKEKPKYFKIAKFIYDIKPFKSENGFFLLVTQYPVRPINMNIIYKINYSNIIPIKDYFSEGLIIYLRYKNKKEMIINKENNKYYLYNKRYEYFINKIYKGQNDLIEKNIDKMELEDKKINNNMNEQEENKNEDLMEVNSIKYKEKEKESLIENDKIKKELILFYQKKFEKSIKINEEYFFYLNNEKYKCEFCKQVFKEYDKEKMFYKCNNNEITFSCCVSFKPINDNFFWCSYCNLFYSNEIKLFYCLMCDKILSKLDSL